MKVATLMKQGVLLVRLQGELDVHGAHEFRTAVDAVLDATGTKYILINFEHVPFIDSSGLGAILGRYKRIAQQGGKVFAVKLGPQVERIFGMAGLLKILEIYGSEEEALELR